MSGGLWLHGVEQHAEPLTQTKHINTHTHTHTHTHKHTHTLTRAHTYTNIHAYMHTLFAAAPAKCVRHHAWSQRCCGLSFAKAKAAA